MENQTLVSDNIAIRCILTYISDYELNRIKTVCTQWFRQVNLERVIRETNLQIISEGIVNKTMVQLKICVDDSIIFFFEDDFPFSSLEKLYKYTPVIERPLWFDSYTIQTKLIASYTPLSCGVMLVYQITQNNDEIGKIHVDWGMSEQYIIQAQFNTAFSSNPERSHILKSMTTHINRCFYCVNKETEHLLPQNKVERNWVNTAKVALNYILGFIGG